MRLFIVFFIVLTSLLTNVNAQINKADLLGSWVKTRTEMKDSSELVPVYQGYVNHFDMTFEKKSYTTNYYPAQKYSNATSSYKLRKNKIVTSKYFAFEIEKLRNDSLVIVEKMAKMSNDKLKRHYLIKKEKIRAQLVKAHIGLNSFVAKPYYTPLFSGNIQRYLNRGLQKRHTNLNLKGNIKLFTKEQKVETEITFRSKNGLYQEKIILDLLNNSFEKWDLTGFEEFDNIIIEFVIIMDKKGKNSYGIKIRLLTNSWEQLQGLYGLTYSQISDGGKYLKLGIRSYERKDMKNAITYFSKAFESNHTLVDALYNRALCYYESKEFNKACYDWKKLIDLGQKRADVLFKDHCIIKK